MPEHTYDVTDGPAAEVEDSDFEFGALERAQAAVDRLKDIYVTDWAPGAISEMYEVLARVRRPASDRRSCFDAFYRLAHDMKGQGGTFDFPLLTHIGEALCRLTAGRQDAGESEMTVLFAHRSEEHTSELQSLMRISYAV